MSERQDLVRDINDAANDTESLLQLIDALHAKGIRTVPRMGVYGGLRGLRFERAGVAVTRSETAVRIGDRHLYSASRHDPILQVLVEAMRNGRPQPRILDEAGEVSRELGIVRLEAGFSPSILGPLQRACEAVSNDDVDSPDLLGLEWGLDHWSHVPEDTLRLALDAPVRPEIEEMDAPHRVAALRCACRIAEIESHGYGLPDEQEIAILRQRAIIANLGAPERDVSFEP